MGVCSAVHYINLFSNKCVILISDKIIYAKWHFTVNINTPFNVSKKLLKAKTILIINKYYHFYVNNAMVLNAWYSFVLVIR